MRLLREWLTAIPIRESLGHLNPPEKINKLLGTDISEDEMIEIFKRIELVPDKATKTVVIYAYIQT